MIVAESRIMKGLIERRNTFGDINESVGRSFIAEERRKEAKEAKETVEWFAKEIDRVQYNILSDLYKYVAKNDVRAKFCAQNSQKYFDEIQQRAYKKYSKEDIAKEIMKLVIAKKTRFDLMR